MTGLIFLFSILSTVLFNPANTAILTLFLIHKEISEATSQYSHQKCRADAEYQNTRHRFETGQ